MYNIIRIAANQINFKFKLELAIKLQFTEFGKRITMVQTIHHVSPFTKEKEIKKIFHCPVCKISHTIYFPTNFAQNRAKYPFTYHYLHKIDDTQNIDEVEKNILTTLYIDKNLNIRGVDAQHAEHDSNILNKEDSTDMIQKLTIAILDLEQDYEKLHLKYESIKKKYNTLLDQTHQ